MTEFSSFGAFAAFLREVQAHEERALHQGVKKAARIIRDEARAEIGHYQDAAGPFPAWAELADATKADRARKGFTENDPLERTGELRDSIEDEVDGPEGVVGSRSKIALWMEMGTPNAAHPSPPRSFLGGAAVRKESEAVNAMTEPVVAMLAGKIPS